jgi:hypothetical protein
VSTSQQVVHKQFYITNQSTHIQFPDSLPGISHSLRVIHMFFVISLGGFIGNKTKEREKKMPKNEMTAER